MNRTAILAAIVLFPGFAPLLAQQEDPTAELEAAGRSIMSDPRLRNVLRSVKQDPGAALDTVKKDPDEAVREATRIFQANTNGIDADTLKAAAAKAQADGTVEKITAKANEAAGKAQADGTIGEITAKANEAVGKGTAMAKPEAGPAAIPGMIPVPKTVDAPPAPPAAAAPAEEIPATRPAPGISGGVPTPVAMPAESGIPVVPADALAAPLPSAVAAASGAVVQETRVEPIAGAAPTTPMIPELPILGADEVPAPVPLSKKYQPGPNGGYPAADRKHMEILSKESIMDNTKGVLLFTGNVFIDHPEFEIKCDKLEIQLAEGVGMEGGEASETGGSFKRAIASGGMVEIKRIAPDEKGKMKTQIAIARIADYNAITKDIVLSGGPPYIQDGDSFVKTNSEDAQIIMRGNGLYEIKGSTNRSQIVIPIENKGGPGKKKGDVGLPSGLEGFSDRLR